VEKIKTRVRKGGVEGGREKVRATPVKRGVLDCRLVEISCK